MKLKQQITNDNFKTIEVKLHYDQELTKGLYSVGKNEFVNKNIKNLKINVNPAKDNNSVGLRFTKKENFIIVTVGIDDGIQPPFYIQFIITKKCSAKLINNCTFYLLEDFKVILIEALEVLNAETLQDLMNLKSDLLN